MNIYVNFQTEKPKTSGASTMDGLSALQLLMTLIPALLCKVF